MEKYSPREDPIMNFSLINPKNFGVLFAAFGMKSIGYWLVVLGILALLIGMIIHFISMILLMKQKF